VHRFSDIAGYVLMTQPLFQPNFGMLPLDQIAHVGVSPSTNLQVISGEIILEVFQPIITSSERH